MKKLFLIPLMAMLCTVMAMATVRTAGSFSELSSAISSAANGDEILLTADITGDNSSVLNITKSITIDGQGHSLSHNGAYSVLRINRNVATPEVVDVTVRNLSLIQPVSNAYGITSNQQLGELTVENCDFSGGECGILISGSTPSPASKLTVKDSRILLGTGSYPIRFTSPVYITMENCQTTGYCGVYFERAQQGYSGSTGARGSSLVAKNCYFDAPNVHSGESNAFSVFPIYDDGITIVLENCGIKAEALGDQSQEAFDIGGYTPKDHRSQDVNITLKGDNTHINGDFIRGNLYYFNDQYNAANCGYENGYMKNGTYDESKKFTWTADINLTIEGGTYSIDPSTVAYRMHIATEDPDTHMPLTYETKNVTIPSTHEVQTIKQQVGDEVVTLYRVVKKAAEKEPGVMYDLNDFVPVEGEGYGDNPVSSFDLSTGAEMTLIQDTTTAGYVQVSDKGDDATVIKVGKVVSEEKVDQTLVINSGLDVQGNSQVVVQAGSTLQIGEGGITTEKPENIVIEADKKGAASLLLDPTITVNQTPNLTVKMQAKQIGRDASGDFYWHRFAMPVASIASWDKEGSLVAANDEYTVQYMTWLYKWDYDANDWHNIAPAAMVPLQGYTLTLASDYIHVDGEGKVVSEGTTGGNLNVLQDVTYTFKGNLVGNTDQKLNFTKEGFNFFGNSYTGYMHALTVLNGIESEHVDPTIYMWNSNEQSYAAVSKYKLEKGRGLENWQMEVAPMQTFILRLRGADDADENISYASAIWGNPRYNNTPAPAPTPARMANVNDEDAYMEIKVTAANGKSDRMDFTEMASKSDAFDRAYDAEKYMNRKCLNLYAEVEGMNLSSVVTDNLLGKTLSLQTLDEVNYTMTFANVEGNEYALLDKVTNEVVAISNGATYTFSAQPNSIVANRFEIVSIHKVPTAVENTDAPVKARGIYTMLGQYMGEDITVLPAGVYVVNGVKIVK